MARRAVVEIDAETTSARAAIKQGVEEPLEDAELQARETNREVREVGGPENIARIEALQSGINDLEGELGSARRASSETRVSIGALTTSSRVFNAQLLTVIGTLGTAGAALTAFTAATTAAEAGGIALSAKFGPEGVQDDFRGLKAEARLTGQVLGDEFAEDANTAATAVSGLLAIVRENADDIGNFADDFAQIARGAPGVLGLLAGGVQGAVNVGEQVSGGEAAAQAVLTRFDRKRRSLLDRGDILRRIGVPKKKILERQISGLEDIREKLVKFAETADGQARRKVVRALQAYQREIDRLNKKLTALEKREQFLERTARILNRIQPGPPAREAPVTGPERLPSGSPLSGGPGGTVQGTARQARKMRRTARQLENSMQDASDAGQNFSDQTKRQLSQIIQQAGQLGTTLVRSFQQGGLKAQEFASIALQAVGSVLTATGNPVLGQTLSTTGSIIRSFQHGGRMPQPGLARLHPPEIITGLPEGARVIGRQESIERLQRAPSPRAPREMKVVVEARGQIKAQNTRIQELRAELNTVKARVAEVT